MTIRYTCTSCASVLKIKDEKAGTEGKCPKCKTAFLIPAPGDEDDGIEIEVAGSDEPATATATPGPDLFDDDVDMPLELTPDVESSDDFDPMDVLAGSAASGKPAAVSQPARNAAPDEKRPSVAELMREFEATKKPKKKESSEPSSNVPRTDAAMATSGTAADALSRAYQQKREKASQPKPQVREVDPDKQLMYEFIGKVAIGLVLALVVGYGMFRLITRESYDGPPLREVTGIVRENGQPLPGVQVQFSPVAELGDVAKGRSNGMTNDLGEFELMYTSDWYGATIGDHDVVIYDAAGTPMGMPGNQARVTVTEDGDNEFTFDL